AHGVVPTARADAISGPLAAGLALLEKSLLEPPPFEPMTTERRFEVAASDYAEFLLLPPLLRTLAREAPKLAVSIRPLAADPFRALVRGDIDLVLGVNRPGSGAPDIQSRHLFDERLACVVREGHPLTRGRFTLARFAAAKHVLIAPQGTPGGPVDDALAARGLRRHTAVTVPHFLAAPHIVAQTDLVLTMASRLAASFATMLPLRILEPPVELPLVAAFLFWHERCASDPAHAWFRERIAEAARVRLSARHSRRRQGRSKG
ncbi:MAG TPA: LysR substrate-binding domain-containing protein, partial [Polyangiaceae bacterium]|nr:LysR substrate-binding domain-containing protein [Polyangiaceae bacterium]